MAKRKFGTRRNGVGADPNDASFSEPPFPPPAKQKGQQAFVRESCGDGELGLGRRATVCTLQAQATSDLKARVHTAHLELDPEGQSRGDRRSEVVPDRPTQVSRNANSYPQLDGS